MSSPKLIDIAKVTKVGNRLDRLWIYMKNETFVISILSMWPFMEKEWVRSHCVTLNYDHQVGGSLLQ
jgi:hypothetical protein